jgi:bacterioferritin
MKKMAVEIVDMDVKKLIELLNAALSDEWLAYYQYWIGAKVVQGKESRLVVQELEEHANEELKHATMIVDRIVKLQGRPILKPEDWYKKTNCGYEAPESFEVKKILQQNIKGEQCAIAVYNELLKKTKDKDPVTYQMVLDILQEEIQHEFDLQTLLEEIS